jgi:hypothetical protein
LDKSRNYKCVRSEYAKPHIPFGEMGPFFRWGILFMTAVGDSPGPDLNFENHTEITSEGQGF